MPLRRDRRLGELSAANEQTAPTRTRHADRVMFTGGLLADGVRDIYRRATIAINLSPPGLFDKAALESMLTGVPTVVSNPAFDPLLGDHVSRLRLDSPDDVTELAACLRS